MRPDTIDLLRSRFQGHEAPVDPGAWQAIQGKLAVSAPVADQDRLNDLFRDRFQGHEANVDPGLWQNISAQLGHTATVGSVGSGGFMGWAAAIGVVAIGVGTMVFFTRPDSPTTISEAPVPKSAVPAPLVTPEETIAGPTEPAMAIPAAARPDPGPARKEPATIPQVQDESTMTGSPIKSRRPTDPITTIQVPEPSGQEGQATENGTALVEQIISELTSKAEKASLDATQKATPTPVTEQIPEVEVIVEEPQPGSSSPTPLVEDKPLPELYVPDVFTPNGDGVNDVYTISAEGFEHTLLRVYSVKNNELVFSTDIGESWTGSNCLDGYYLVAVEAVTSDGRLVTEGKVVWLNRTR